VVQAITIDCDRVTLRVLGRPTGAVCHTGAADGFHGQPLPRALGLGFLDRLEHLIGTRRVAPPEDSDTARLLAQGRHRLAQKVGEEGLEVALAAVGPDDAAVRSECADLLFHLRVMLKERGQSLGEVVLELEARHAAREVTHRVGG
jgi:phosphoribosyl-AMP cyclohydrolase / phosphoribosyl-ATP pyrophosphohydrolase